MSTAKKGLGKGLDELFGVGGSDALQALQEIRIKNVFITDLTPNKEQPRKHFDEQMLGDLAQSIKEHGILQPLVVSPINDNKYMIVAGERRWRAAKLAGLEKVPAIVRTTKQLEQLELAIVENVQRVDLSVLEQAAAIAALHDQFNVSYETIGKRLGKAVPTISNIVRLLRLPKDAQKALQDGKISEGHARTLLTLEGNEKQQLALLNKIVTGNLTVREAEQLAQSMKKQVTVTRSNVRLEEDSHSADDAVKQFATFFGVPISVRKLAHGGQLQIRYKNEAELRALIKKINNNS